MSLNVLENGTAKKLAGNFIIDQALDPQSTNAVQNKVLQRIIGNEDISTIGDGTITGALLAIIKSMEVVSSHIGMIVQSTTLDTEEKVISLYGGTKWTRLDNLFLVGAGDLYEANSTGGSKDAIVVSHSHSIDSFDTTDGAGGHSHTYTYLDGKEGSAGFAEGGYGLYYYGYGSGTTSTDGAHNHTIPSHNTNSLGVDGTDKNLPPYKAVYIWERTE